MFKQRGALLFLFIAFTLMVTASAFAQENMGFEKGTFENWELEVGKLDSFGVITVVKEEPKSYNAMIIEHVNTNVLDGWGLFPVFSPNGSKYSVLLGNSLKMKAAQRLSYKLKVPPTGVNNIILNYAVVLENPVHDYYEQPRFTVKIFDITDNKYLSCPAFDYVGDLSSPGAKLSANTKRKVFYKDWSSASIDLSELNGKEIRLEFTVNHCLDGLHFGYAYIDIADGVKAPIQGNTYCPGQTKASLFAPPGFKTYAWYTPDFKTLLGTKQYLGVDPTDSTLKKLAVVLNPYYGMGCVDTLYTTLIPLNEGFKTVVKDSIVACPGTSVDLTQPDVTAGSSPNLTFEYFSSAALGSVPAPYKITKSGLYYIKLSNEGGCSNILPIRVIFRKPSLKINTPAAVDYPTTVDITSCFVPEKDITYSYYADAATTIPLINASAIVKGGTFYIKAESEAGCSDVQPVTVTIKPPPPYTVVAANAFTPNSDGINDRFLVALEGYVTFNDLKIYDRYGKLVFNTGNKTQGWDGTINGRSAPAGTYYWLFEGYDIYNQQKVAKSSFITLLR